MNPFVRLYLILHHQTVVFRCRLQRGPNKVADGLFRKIRALSLPACTSAIAMSIWGYMSGISNIKTIYSLPKLPTCSTNIIKVFICIFLPFKEFIFSWSPNFEFSAIGTSLLATQAMVDQCVLQVRVAICVTIQSPISGCVNLPSTWCKSWLVKTKVWPEIPEKLFVFNFTWMHAPVQCKDKIWDFKDLKHYHVSVVIIICNFPILWH